MAGGSSGITLLGLCDRRRPRAPSATSTAPTRRPGAETIAEMPENPDAEHFAMHSFGAQFAEVRVDGDTGEVRVPRMLGVFSVGRVINPWTAGRSSSAG